MRITKPFAIATEGPTVDGRVITRQQIEDMAKNYDTRIYCAGVNLEHFLSFHPDSIFSMHGKVRELSTRETEIFGEKRSQLMAVAEVSEVTADLQKDGKKGFASIEIMQNFTGRGITYLTGLALTDTPASLGTEPMRFSSFSGSGDSVKIASSEEIVFALEGENPAENSVGDRLLEKVKTLLGLSGKNAEARLSDQSAAVTVIAESQRALLEKVDQMASSIAAFGTHADELAALVKTHADEINALRASLENTPATSARPAATGGTGHVTDC